MKALEDGELTLPSGLLASALTPAAILKDPSLSAGARLLWVLLAEYQGHGEECFPLEERLAVPLGVKTRQFQNYIKELSNYVRRDPPGPFPLIEVKRVLVGKKRKTRNIYSLLRLPFLAVNQMADGPGEGPLADGGNAQYFARRPGSDTQDTAAAAERPAAPTEDVGAARNAAPRSDAQSFARPPAGGAQDAAAGRPAIPGRDRELAPDGIAIACDNANRRSRSGRWW
jgi:hypothetical protein